MKKLDLIKDIADIISPLTGSIVEVFITPRLKELNKEFTISGNELLNKISNRFKNYLIRAYQKHAILNTLVFHNRQRLLKKLYVPLTIYLVGGKDKSIKVDDDFYKKIKKGLSKLLIVDTAGMGKSTIMKRIFLNLIDNKEGIPILIELRRLSHERKILDEIFEQLNPIDDEFDKDFVTRLIRKGNFIFLLDGFDEIALRERQDVTTDLQNFISKSRKNKFVITSRPEEALSSFGEFQRYNINSLKLEESYDLLRKYDSQNEVSEQLIKKIEETELPNVKEFLENPLLVSLLFTAFEHKQTIPFKKHIFYRQVYDALFESHDLTKGDSFMRNKLSGLDIDDFHQVLRYIGYLCLFQQKIEFSKDEALNLIHKANKFCTGLDFKESSFLQDILKSVPIFTKDGNYYKWAHKSLQEYFAAQFVYLDSNEKKKAILKNIASSKNVSKYFNLLDIYYSIDFKSFNNIVIKKLLEDFIAFYESSYSNIKGVSNEMINLRKEVLFGFQIIYSDNMEIEEDIEENTYFSGHLHGKNIWAVQSPSIVLIDLLQKKSIPVFSKIETEEFDFHNEVSDFLLYLKEMYKDDDITISLNEDELFNKPEKFEENTQWLKRLFAERKRLNYSKCTKLLDEITNTLENQTEDDFFIENL